MKDLVIEATPKKIDTFSRMVYMMFFPIFLRFPIFFTFLGIAIGYREFRRTGPARGIYKPYPLQKNHVSPNTLW